MDGFPTRPRSRGLIRSAASLAASLAVALLAQAPPQPPPPSPTPPAGPKPVVQVVGDERFDFGSFWPDGVTQLQHAFTLKNAGDAELQILKVQPG